MLKCQQLLAFYHLWAEKIHAHLSGAWNIFYNLGAWSKFSQTAQLHDAKTHMQLAVVDR